MPVPEGYHPRIPSSVAVFHPPATGTCDGCGNQAGVLESFEKEGAPDIMVCGSCQFNYRFGRKAVEMEKG